MYKNSTCMQLCSNSKEKVSSKHSFFYVQKQKTCLLHLYVYHSMSKIYVNIENCSILWFYNELFLCFLIEWKI